MQDYPGAPGTARQGSTRTIVSTNDGGNATQPRAPGHERPRAALRAARHGRLSAATRAPGADVPPATPAGAPGQYCLSAAPRAPGANLPLAISARAPGQHRLSAAPIATAPVPAGLRRLRQAVLPRVPATPNTLTYPHSRSTVSSLRRKPQSTNRPVAGRRADSPSLAGKGPGVRSKSLPIEEPTLMSRPSPAGSAATTIHQVHPAIQVPPHPRSCSTACTGFLRQHPSRAPRHSPSLPGRGPGGRSGHPLHWSLLRGRTREGATNH